MNYDVIVIGAGPGGYAAAIRAAQLGLKTACIEKRETLGGTCLNVGCIPSKALLHSSEWFWKMKKEGKENGLLMKDLSFDYSVMTERKNRVVSGFTKGIEGLFQKNKVTWIKGEGRFKDPHTVEVKGESHAAKHFILATGSEPVPLPFLPFDEKKILSSTGALALKAIPQKLLVVGAGVIGVE
ncbi:MAG: FAD-dependent oxidoreductase, partial [Chlamydiae bacterium]|nr:FAD-dependent oxidoreductase [Chlamydiota bacterium]